jgi:hypothetical protein
MHSFLNSVLNWTKWSVSHPSCLCLYAVKQDGGWTPKAAWTVWRRPKCLTSAGKRTIIPRSQVRSCLYTDFTIPTSVCTLQERIGFERKFCKIQEYKSTLIRLRVSSVHCSVRPCIRVCTFTTNKHKSSRYQWGVPLFSASSCNSLSYLKNLTLNSVLP